MGKIEPLNIYMRLDKKDELYLDNISIINTIIIKYKNDIIQSNIFETSTSSYFKIIFLNNDISQFKDDFITLLPLAINENEYDIRYEDYLKSQIIREMISNKKNKQKVCDENRGNKQYSLCYRTSKEIENMLTILSNNMNCTKNKYIDKLIIDAYVLHMGIKTKSHKDVIPDQQDTIALKNIFKSFVGIGKKLNYQTHNVNTQLPSDTIICKQISKAYSKLKNDLKLINITNKLDCGILIDKIEIEFANQGKNYKQLEQADEQLMNKDILKQMLLKYQELFLFFKEIREKFNF